MVLITNTNIITNTIFDYERPSKKETLTKFNNS